MTAKKDPGRVLDNGQRVRPDFQTKLFSAVIVLVFLGAISWVGTTLASMAARMVRVETLLEQRNKWEDRIEERLDRIDQKLEAR